MCISLKYILRNQDRLNLCTNQTKISLYKRFECAFLLVSVIWESTHEKLLGIIINKLNFSKHLEIICKKVGAKVTALSRMTRMIPLEKKRLLMKAFIVL